MEALAEGEDDRRGDQACDGKLVAHRAALARMSRPIRLDPIPMALAYGGTTHESTPHPTAIIATLTQREAHERAVARDLPVAAGDWLGAHLVSNRRDENRQVDEVGHRVGQEEHDEAVEAEAGDDATDRRAEAEPDVDPQPRDAARALE
jgi:hypothetical protein